MTELKKHILVLLITSIPVFSHTQGLFSYFNWTAYSDGPEKVDHFVFDLNWTTLMDLPGNVKQTYYRNVGMGAYIFHDHPMNKKSTLAWALGVGVSSFNIHHNATFVNDPLPGGGTFTNMIPLADSVKFRTNKHNITYLELPFELRIRSMKISTEERRRANFKLYLGFKAGYLVGMHSKYVDKTIKYKLFTFYNTEMFHYGPTLRIGFKKLSFNAFYSLTPLFVEGRGVQVHPFSVGLTWMRL
jgi:hypothetical protein